MEKIKEMRFGRCRNNDHFQFMTDFNTLVVNATPETLNIANVLPPFSAALAGLNDIFKIDTGSTLTPLIGNADVKRDKIWSAIYMRIRATLMCQVAREVEAAEKLKRLFDLYGNVRKLSLIEESAALNNLIEDLEKEENAAASQTVGLTRWVNTLKEENQKVQDLVQQRREEVAHRESGDVRAARDIIDPLYEKIVSRINALVELEMATPEIEEFVLLLNKQIKDFDEMLAARQGRRDSEEDEVPAEPEIEQ